MQDTHKYHCESTGSGIERKSPRDLQSGSGEIKDKSEGTIRKCTFRDLGRIYEIINDAATKYKRVIPADCWKEPYMSCDKLKREMNDVELWGYEENGKLAGVMGIQHMHGITLVRHAYVSTSEQNRGIGGKLVLHLLELTAEPVLVATWSNALWAIRFYEKYGFRLIPAEEGYHLQRKYWGTPEIMIKASVVLADKKWFMISILI